MNQGSIFWTAFRAGLAGPASLYAPPAPYYLYLSSNSVAQSFGIVAMYLDRASGVYLDVGQSSVGPSAPAAATLATA